MSEMQRRRGTVRGVGVLLGGLALLSVGCRSAEPASVYLHPNADFSTYSRVAVLPFGNLSSDRFAGERLREILTIELSALGLFDLVELGEVNQVLRKQDVPGVTEIGTEKVRELGKAMGVQAFLTGSVMGYQERRQGNITAPMISLSLRMIDVETGILVWSAANDRTGLSAWTRFFGVGEESQVDASRQLVRELIETLY